MYTLTIRRMEDATVLRLKEVAARKNMSLESLARSVLSDFALSSEVSYIEDKYASLVKDVTALYQTAISESKEVISDNTYMIGKLMEIMEDVSNE